MRRPRTGIRPTFGNPNANSTTIQPFPQPSTNRFPPPTRTQPTATQPQPFHNHFPNYPATAFQPRTNYREPQPVHNRPSTATQPRANHNHASIVFQSHSSRPKPSDGRSRAWQKPTTQPSFVSNPRTTRFRLNHQFNLNHKKGGRAEARPPWSPLVRQAVATVTVTGEEVYGSP